MPETTVERRVRVTAATCLLLLPFALLYSRVGSEALLATIDILFLARCILRRDGAWLRRPEFWIPLLLWLWLMVCSALGPMPSRALPQAVASLRYWLLAAALARWLLASAAPQTARTRRRLHWMVAGCAVWIALECWQQYLTGSNLFGAPRFVDGSLTGPFLGPRAGPAYVLLLPVAMLPPVMALLERPGLWPRLVGALLAILAIVTLLLIGQRMPALLGLFGLVVSAGLLRRLRPVALAAAVFGALTLAALPVISPPTYQKLVLHFLTQMEHFWQSPYGQIYVRAAAIAVAHPLLGQGFDGYRLVCAEPAYAHAQAVFGLPPLAVADEGCNIHPHQFWLEAATAAGLPGLLLFGAVTLTWLACLARRLFAGQDALRVALFVTVLAWLWPLASTSGFYNMPVAGWGFLIAGWGLALSPAVQPAAAARGGDAGGTARA